MLSKIAGVVLLVAGFALAVGMLGGVAVGLAAFLWLMVKVLVVCGVTYWGWRWLHHASAWAKVMGAFLLVGGAVLSFPLAGAVITGTLGLLGALVKAVVAGGLLYLGWRWIRGRGVAGGGASVPRL